MSKAALVVAGNMAAVALITIIIVYFRTASMAFPEDLAKKGLDTVRRENIIFFGLVMPVVVGLISLYVYRHWFVANPLHFLFLAIGIGIALSIMGAIFYRRSLGEFSIMHIVHIIFFGWLMPFLLK